MPTPSIKIINNGDTAITLEFDAPIGEALSRQIYAYAELIEQQLEQCVLETIPGYQSLTLCYNSLQVSNLELRQSLADLLKQPPPECHYLSRLVEIPVCYSRKYAPDRDTVSQHCGLDSKQIVELHSKAEYLVFMLGFSPGFLYLGGLDPQLHCPRKSMPDRKVPAGSVGIGGEQTGIYPQATPGGWQIIGRTPVEIFSANSKQPFIAQPLDRIKFVAVGKQEFKQIKKAHR